MKRRIFVHNMALAGLGVGLTPLNSCSIKTPNDKSAKEGTEVQDPFLKLSLAQWSIHRMINKQGTDPYAFASLAKKWGFDGLDYVSQLFIPKKESMGGASDFNSKLEAMVRQLKEEASSNHQKSLVMMTDLAEGPGDLAISDISMRTRSIEAHFPWIDATSDIGCHSMRINLFGERNPDLWKATSIEALGVIGEYASRKNINILVENHGWLSSNAKLLAQVIEEVGMENVGSLPDFGNFCTRVKNLELWGECEEEYDKYLGVKELMPTAKALSAKSYDFDEKGQTTIDFVRMLQIVKNAGYRGYIGVEYEGKNPNEEEGILATKRLLEESVKQLV